MSTTAAVVDLPPHHGDAFDRMLIVQAQLEPMKLFSNDEALVAYGECVLLV